MIVADQLHMDPDEFRSVLKSKITSYNNAIERLRAEKPVVDPNAFGEGFSDRGGKVAVAVKRVHERTLNRLEVRVRQFEEMLRLVADVDATDQKNAAELSRHV